MMRFPILLLACLLVVGCGPESLAALQKEGLAHLTEKCSALGGNELRPWSHPDVPMIYTGTLIQRQCVRDRELVSNLLIHTKRGVGHWTLSSDDKTKPLPEITKIHRIK